MDITNSELLLNYVAVAREIKELSPASNPWIPLWAALAGSLLGWVPLIAGNLYKMKKSQASIEAALRAEVTYLLQIIEVRDYLGDFQRTADFLDAENQHRNDMVEVTSKPYEPASVKSQILIPDDYCKVYKAHLTKLGKLPPEMAKNIVNFYGLLDSVVQDCKPGGALTIQGYAEQYKEALRIGTMAVQIAKKIVP